MKPAQELFQLARTALERAGAHAAMARVPFDCALLRNGRADGAAQPVMAADRAGVCLIDNRDGLPYVPVEWAVREAIERARRNGIAFAGIRNSAHVGVLGIHLLPVARTRRRRSNTAASAPSAPKAPCSPSCSS